VIGTLQGGVGGMSEEWKRGVRENVREEGERVVSGEGGMGRGRVSALSGKIRAELGSG